MRSLAAALLRPEPAPCRVTVGSVAERLTTNRDVEQRILFLRSDAEREATLHRQLQLVPAAARVLVFCATKRACEALARSLRREHNCASLHGDKDQAERERALADFRAGAVPLLIATDVAARGLDIPEVERVINFEFPSKPEDYVHRIGRTGRAGAKGLAVTFMTPTDAKHAGALVKILKESGLKKADIPKELRQMAKLLSGTSGPSGALPASASIASAAASSRPRAGGLYD